MRGCMSTPEGADLGGACMQLHVNGKAIYRTTVWCPLCAGAYCWHGMGAALCRLGIHVRWPLAYLPVSVCNQSFHC